tara:strand:+ start:22707 stop:23471 length:765 start_codon:yes stop_codon:yes gene_type:complete
MNDFDKKVIKMYNKEDMSTYQIAEIMDTYPNKVRRTLKKHGYDLKSKSSAQSNALKSGRREHPTKGKVRTLAEKVKISSGLSSYWEEMSEVERDRRSEQARDRWNAMTEKQKESMKQKRVQAIQKSAREGSKLEKFLEGRLNDSGYSVRMHQVIIPAENLEIDLYIPDLKTIIEVDGPSHFLPIWGEDKLQKQINADLRKSGALLSKGYAVIRVKSLGQESLSKREQIAEIVLDCLSKINKKFPPKSKRFIEVE